MSRPDLHIAEGSTWADLRVPLHRILTTAPDEAVVVATSGSSGTPKQVRLTGAALRASGEATAAALGGHGRWLLALPTHHVAGLQVVARSVLAGTTPVQLPVGMPFTPAAFAAAVEELGGPAQAPPTGHTAGQPAGQSPPRRYASLVPTQLHRLLEDADGSRAVAALDAILLGGAAADRSLLDRAHQAGARVVTTYGMSETCGGCVYDGRPLAGLRVRLDDEGRVQLAGPMLADGYLGPDGSPDTVLTAERFVTEGGTRWFRTDDRGALDGGVLRILGRVDDVIVTGGHKVEPRDVEAALRQLPEVDDALVVGLPDREWGQVVAALVVHAPATATASTGPTGAPGTPTDRSGNTAQRLRDRLRHTLPPHALPRRVEVVDAIPLLPSGKPDLGRARAALAQAP